MIKKGLENERSLSHSFMKDLSRMLLYSSTLIFLTFVLWLLIVGSADDKNTSKAQCIGDESVDIFRLIREKLPPGIEIAYDDEYSTHAYGFSASAAFFHLPMEELFSLCIAPPLRDFTISLVYRVNPNTIGSKNRQCLFHLVKDDRVQISIVLQNEEVILQYGVRSRLREIRLVHIPREDANRWHSLHLQLNQEIIGVSTDCKQYRLKEWRGYLYMPLDVEKWNVNIANCDADGTQFEGMIKDMKFSMGQTTPNEDCTLPRTQRKRHNRNFELRMPITSRHKWMAPKADTKYIADKNFGIGDKVCYFQSRGDVWFDTQTQTLRMCYSGLWEPRPPGQTIQQTDATSLKRRPPRLDYPVWYQNLPSETPFSDLEIFSIEGEGLFLAAAAFKDNHLEKLDSPIYKWTNGHFEHFQNISTNSAMSWEHFTIGKQFFLAVANFGHAHRDSVNMSVIYRWEKSKKKFVKHQEIATWAARDVEHFAIRGHHYLAIANHGRRNVNNIHSVVYKWNKKSRSFHSLQPIRTASATDWTYFKINRQHFLLGSNSYSGGTTRMDSILYVWKGNSFKVYQKLPTRGAADWEYFKFKEGHFIAVANAYDLGPHLQITDDAYKTKSTIFRFNHGTKQFESFQNITTNSATDWEFFTLGDDAYLVTSNMRFSKDEVDHRSVIYRWQGMDGFAPVHRMLTESTADWETFSVGGISYLVCANDGRV